MTMRKLGIAGVFLALLLAAARPARASTIYGAPQIGGLGISESFPFGEVFTVGAVDTTLESFSFLVANIILNTSATYTGYVYEWDPVLTRLTGSALFSNVFTQAPYDGITLYSFAAYTPNLQLTPGEQYIAFIGERTGFGQGQACNQVSPDCPGGSASPLTTFYQGPGGANAWTSNSWSTEPYRVAFNITLGESQPTPVPEPATLLLVGAGAGIAALRRRRWLNLKGVRRQLPD